MALGAGAHLVENLRDAVLADDGEVGFAAGLARRIEDAEGAGIGGRGDQDVLAPGLVAEELGDGQMAGLAHAAAFDRSGSGLREDP